MMKKSAIIAAFSLSTAAVGVFYFRQSTPAQTVPVTGTIASAEGSNKPSSFERLIQPFIPKPTPTPLPQLPSIPTQKVIPGGKHVFQTFNNCGPAALSIMLSLYNISADQRTLGLALRPYQNTAGNNDDKSVTLDELAQKAQEYGFLTYHRPAGSIEILQQFIANDMPVITRTLLQSNEDIGHFRIVKGYDQTTRQLIQDDSLQGRNVKYSSTEFVDLWKPYNFEFLVVVPPEKRLIAETILGELLDPTTAWSRSLQISEAQIDQDPGDIFAIFNASVAQYYLGDYQGSIKSYESVAERLPFRTLWYQLEPILAYYRAGQDDQALQIIEQVLAKNNRAYSELHYIRGLILRRRGDSAGAEAAFAQADRYNSTGSWKINVRE